MSEGDFDFRSPAERREPKQFQPPPWEEEAFQRREERRRLEEEAEDSANEPGPTPPEVESAEKLVSPAVAPESAPQRSAEGLDDAAVLEMLASLRAEDPPATQGLFRVAVGSAMVLFAIGGMLVIWAMAAAVGSRTTGTAGLLMAFTFGGFGAGFIGAGWWLMRRALKRRGVL